MIELVLVLVTLHTPSGHKILLNPDAVTSMHNAIKDKPNTLMSNEVRCLIHTNDGKFVPVVETCDEVYSLIQKNLDN